MSAQPGWYDAGVPGQERWWDGTQWTAHTRATPGAEIPGSAPQFGVQSVQPVQAQYAQQQYAPPVAQLAPMGWFPVVGAADVRWWDGAGWTPYRIRDGRVRSDAFAVEPGNMGIPFGILFIALGFMQFSTYSISGQPFFAVAPILFVVAGIFWLIGGFRASQLKTLPAPSTVPVFDSLTRPLPGEVEGAGAGWFPVSGRISRWWTGAQWSSYVGQKFGVRPTQSGVRAYRASMAVGWGFAGLGVLGIILGVIVIAAVGGWAGAAIIIPAGIFVLVGGLVVLMIYIRRYTLILPTQPPPLR